MQYLFGFMACLLISLINLPYILDGSANLFNVISMAFCISMALFILAVGVAFKFE